MCRQLILDANSASLELMFQQAQGIDDNAVDINFCELCAAGARKVQQVIHDLRGPKSLAGYFLEQRALLGIALNLLRKHLRIGRDHS